MILTFDIEEWFHLLDFDATRSESQWDSYEIRIYDNVERLLRILDETNSRATFFIIGWVAQRYPDLVRKIAERYQIGTHTMNHQLVWQQSREDFRNDVVSSIHLLEDITGKPVECFRAPGFSIRESELWALDILYENGIRYDSSIFPAKGSHGGIPGGLSNLQREGYMLLDFRKLQQSPELLQQHPEHIIEFPISSHKICGKDLVFNGGGYFRLMPYSLIQRWSKESAYLLSYIHPRDLDATQPMLPGLPLSRRFKSYVGLKTAESKLRKYLSDFQFTDIRTAVEAILNDQKPNHQE